MPTTLSIIIPAYNEERTIQDILDKIAEVTLIEELAKEIIIINDCSTDKTNDIIRDYIDTHPYLSINLLSQELFFWHSIGNGILTFLSNMMTNLNLTDMETCYKLFKAQHLKSLHLKENRFGFEPEVTAKISRIPGIRIYEVGISYFGRTYDEGKKINYKDGFRAIYCIVKYGLFGR